MHSTSKTFIIKGGWKISPIHVYLCVYQLYWIYKKKTKKQTKVANWAAFSMSRLCQLLSSYTWCIVMLFHSKDHTQSFYNNAIFGKYFTLNLPTEAYLFWIDPYHSTPVKMVLILVPILRRKCCCFLVRHMYFM